MVLFTPQVNQLVRNDRHARQYFLGTFPTDKLPFRANPPLGIVVNLDKSYQPGSHWVAVWVSEQGVGTYFDSFGLPPVTSELNQFMNRMPWRYNKKRFQHLTSDDCGYYAVLFLILSSKGWTLPDIQYIFYEHLGRLNDILVKGYIGLMTRV